MRVSKVHTCRICGDGFGGSPEEVKRAIEHVRKVHYQELKTHRQDKEREGKIVFATNVTGIRSPRLRYGRQKNASA